jgi:hypothetical protein
MATNKIVEGHIPIPTWAWLASGVAMAVYAKTVEVRNPDAAGMLLFFYLGIGLVLFGLGKFVFDKKKEKIDEGLRREKEKFGQQLQHQYPQHNNPSYRQQQMHPQHNAQHPQSQQSAQAQSSARQMPAQPQSSIAQQLHHQSQQSQHEIAKQQAQPAQHSIISCPGCHANNYVSSNFCHRCGARLR